MKRKKKGEETQHPANRSRGSETLDTTIAFGQ
jgi:hypothetical protein